MPTIDYIFDLMAQGRYTFTVNEIADVLQISLTAARAALRRLRKKGIIATPYRGFWVVVPAEYRNFSCLPPDQFIPQLMEHLGEPYYVGLLSAAEYYGAAHQRPQIFQIVLNKHRSSLECGRIRVGFIARKSLASLPTIPRKTQRGFIHVSTPEVTAFDLVGYPEHAAGLDNVATILIQLAEHLGSDEIAAAAKLSPMTWAQRLGYLLNLVGESGKAEKLAEHIRQKDPVPTPLFRAKPFKGAAKDPLWQIMINGEVEVEV
ncbi:MAG: type IV toxin-antitoxin system AbiEi family antitoxin [Pseudomonadota bacterium]|nr:type IV toxin-antitoxin system AbiEi family antitoxin [Pseudomonadota bacterium]